MNLNVNVRATQMSETGIRSSGAHKRKDYQAAANKQEMTQKNYHLQ